MTVKRSNEINPFAADFKTMVALGLVPGWSVFRKFGMNPDVDAGTEQIWPPGTVQVLPTSAAVASVVSDNVGDDVAGVGALTILVKGLDANYELAEEEVIMTGAVAATTTQTFIRLYRAYVITSGTNETNAGNISLSIDGDLQAYIEAGEGQTHITQYTVPLSHTLVLDNYTVNSGQVGSQELAAQFCIRLFGESWRTLSDVFPYEGLYDISAPRIVLPEKTDSYVRTAGAANNVNVSAEYSGYLIHNDFL